VAYLNRLSDLAVDDGRFAEGSQHAPLEFTLGDRMARTARISTPVEAATQPTVVVPVVFGEGAAFIAEIGAGEPGRSEYSAVAFQGVVAQTGLKPRPGASPSFEPSRTRTSPSSVSARPTLTRRISTRGCRGGALRERRLGRLLLATDGIDDPSIHPGARHRSLARFLQIQAG